MGIEYRQAAKQPKQPQKEDREMVELALIAKGFGFAGMLFGWFSSLSKRSGIIFFSALGLLLLGVLLGGCGDNATKLVKVAHLNIIYVEHQIAASGNISSYLTATDSVVNTDKREIIITCPCYPTDGNNAIGAFLPIMAESKLALTFPDDRTYRVTIWRKNEKHVYNFPPVKNKNQ